MKQKRFSFHFWAVGLLLFTACAPVPTSSATPTTIPEQEPVSTQTESPASTELAGPSFTNPVYKNDFPDPHIILVNDTYYAYATAAYGSSSNIQGITSKDLVNWENLGDALSGLPKVMGPGGGAFFTDKEGNLWMAYHAWTGANVGNSIGERSLHLDVVTFEGDKPVTNGPSSTPQLLP